MTRATDRLAEADTYVRRQHPDWSGFSRDEPDVTIYALAEWWRKRNHFGRVFKVLAEPADDNGRVANVVTLYSKLGGIDLHGFAWGYGGEGPTGLAAVLADALPGRFPDFEAARAWVASLDGSEGWEVRA